ncbi:MAG: hypothetical protein K8L91_20570 [Anaerolineae bacterium]|nr:hypothetical protein [Anaerolineae bacterium]
MKINWKVIVACIFIIGAVAWTANSIRSTSYSGTNLNFKVGSGAVTMTNPSREAVPVQLVGAGGLFTVSSDIQGVSGLATRGDTSSTAYSFDFALPPGVSEFTVVSTYDVEFVADTNTRLEATVHASKIGTKIGILAVFVFVALFFISYVTSHRWLYKLLGRTPASKLHSKPYTGEEETDMRAYGDNRGKPAVEPPSNP